MNILLVLAETVLCIWAILLIILVLTFAWTTGRDFLRDWDCRRRITRFLAEEERLEAWFAMPDAPNPKMNA